DWVARRGITFAEFLNPDSFRTALEWNKKKSGRDFDVEEYVKMYDQARERLRPFCVNGLDVIREMEGDWIWEGAQGALLDIRSGSYPYVTCSSPSLIPVGCTHKLGIAKAYTTRVDRGEGPLPTELGGIWSAKYCGQGAEHDFFFEVREYLGMDLDLGAVRKFQRENDVENLQRVQDMAEAWIAANRPMVLGLLNSVDPFLQGVGLRLVGDEYGATTRRPRRTGWFDATIVRDAVTVGEIDSIMLTKLDVLTGIKELTICTGYKVDGQEIGTPMDRTEWGRIKPIERKMAGWDVDIRDVRDFDKLPGEAREYVNEIADLVDCDIGAISVGPMAEETIVRK
ncbi:MAG TPA: adenylosuccinate synthetase, partial [archaeon]|nr:adenylosuccinate synthetase [archaeon]